MAATSRNPKLFNDYGGFVEKFKPKKTTDDCYTPEIVYSAIADWVANEYHLNKADFVCPFYPGGDYERFDYDNKIVVDNPPFSILSEIIKFYYDKNIRFFLFAPTLTLCRYGDYCTVLPIGTGITYENGAVVNTSFATNRRECHGVFHPDGVSGKTAMQTKHSNPKPIPGMCQT